MELFMTIETQQDADVFLGSILNSTIKKLVFITNKEAGLAVDSGLIQLFPLG